MRWGPVVASVVAALGLVGAGFTGISAFDDDMGARFGLVALEGFVGETLLVVAVALVGLAVAVAMRRVPAGALIGVGLVAAVTAFVSRSSLASDAESVTEYITGAGSATGIDSRLVAAASEKIDRVTRVEVDGALNLLAVASAAALVAVGWVAWLELEERRRVRSGGEPDAPGVPSGDDDPGSEPITDSSQVPHT